MLTPSTNGAFPFGLACINAKEPQVVPMPNAGSVSILSYDTAKISKKSPFHSTHLETRQPTFTITGIPHNPPHSLPPFLSASNHLALCFNVSTGAVCSTACNFQFRPAMTLRYVSTRSTLVSLPCWRRSWRDVAVARRGSKGRAERSRWAGCVFDLPVCFLVKELGGCEGGGGVYLQIVREGMGGDGRVRQYTFPTQRF